MRYQRGDTGTWTPLGHVQDPLGNSPQYSSVLQTWIRVHQEQGFQCQHPKTGKWIEHSASIREEGREEGLWEGLTKLADAFRDFARRVYGDTAAAALMSWLDTKPTRLAALDISRLDDLLTAYLAGTDLETTWQQLEDSATGGDGNDNPNASNRGQ